MTAARAHDLPPLRLGHLYPSVLNVAGDGGNLLAVQQRCAWRGIGTETLAVERGDEADLADVDIVFFHGGQDVEMQVIEADLRGRAPSLRDAADRGVAMLAVCAGLQLLGHRYIPQSGPTIEGAAVLDLETRGASRRFMQHAAVEVTWGDEVHTVVGFENHSGVTELGPRAEPFGRIVAGSGNNGRDGLEGARRDNVIATYLHGPLLPRNPWFADHLVRVALERKVGGPVELTELDDSIELLSHRVVLGRALHNRGLTTAIEPARLAR